MLVIIFGLPCPVKCFQNLFTNGGIMIRISDYLFYRFCKFYIGDRQIIISYSSGLVSAVQFFTLLSIFALITLFVDFKLTDKWLFAPPFLVIIILNWYRYEYKIDPGEFESKWNDEEKGKRKLKGYLIVAYTIFVVLFPMVIGYLRHNLGLIE
jgi:hypothetical protein